MTDPGQSPAIRGTVNALLGRLAPMSARDTNESHRVSTPLELLFDLCFVVAVSEAARELNADLSAHHISSGIVGYLMVFFAIWWAWVNFTWFASAYDVDDVPYRIITFVQIVGVLILAAGVPVAFNQGSFATITIGYVVMRVAMVTQWLRAAAGDPPRRPAALRYAAAISILQIGWVLRLFLPHEAAEVAFYVLAAAEMAVPAWAERGGRGSPWHPEHIAERYGLFTLIVLGECVSAATLAIQAASSSHGLSAALIGVATGGVLLVFALWWWYFEHPAEHALRMSRQLAFVWGYGHYGVFAALAALGAGLGVAAEASRHSGGLGQVAGLTVAISVSVFLVTTGLLEVRLNSQTSFRVAYVAPFVIVLIVLGAGAGSFGIGVAVTLMGVVVTALVVLESRLRHRGLNR